MAVVGPAYFSSQPEMLDTELSVVEKGQEVLVRGGMDVVLSIRGEVDLREGGQL